MLEFGKKTSFILPISVLALVLLVNAWLWSGLSAVRSVKVEGISGTDGSLFWDLNSFNFNNNIAHLQGAVEFIPSALLSPLEFLQREDEAIFGEPGTFNFSTSRIRILLPEGSYTFSRISTDYSDRIFVNGIWLHDVGLPSENGKKGAAFTERITFTAQSVDGVIEILQQTSNFGLRGKNRNPHEWRVGAFDFSSSVLRADYTVNIILGCYLVLFMVFGLLYFFLQRPIGLMARPLYVRGFYSSLYFSLFCLMWFLRSGVTDSRVFAFLVPWLSGYASMRIEYISLPVAAILTLAIIRELFPGVLQLIFNRIVYVISAVVIVLFLFTAVNTIVYVILFYQIICFLSIIYIIIRFAVKLRKIDLTQSIFILGVFIFMYSAVRDFTFYSFSFLPLLPPFSDANFTQIAVFAFVFCEAVSVFMSTMKELDAAKMKEQALAAKNMTLEGEIDYLQERLSELQKIKKSQMLDDVITGQIRLNTVSSIAYLNGEDMLLTPKEFSLLLIFIKNEGRILSYEQIYQLVWELPVNDDKGTLKKHISCLRKKIEKLNSGYTISSIYKKGYCFQLMDGG